MGLLQPVLCSPAVTPSTWPVLLAPTTFQWHHGLGGPSEKAASGLRNRIGSPQQHEWIILFQSAGKQTALPN